MSSQLEKLLQNNYYLYRSARDGYRSYLQAYASYSLKKIFDVNALDLVKVGKAFGFAVPPRVNVSIGGGKGGSGKSGKKRERGDDGEEDQDEGTEEDQEEEHSERRQSKHRRVETLGKNKVQKEMYKKSRERQHLSETSGAQWSR